MKRPIEPSDIRKGDLIRVEHADNGHVTASEYRARNHGHVYKSWEDEPHYLLDRPEPAVELPTEPATGWVEIRGGDVITPQFGRWHVEGDVIYDDDPRHYWNVDAVTAFTPATAVPTEALDELHALVAKAYERGTDVTAGSVGRILATITEANA